MNGSAVVVTGASSGIGRACAMSLSEAGFMVFAGVRCREDAESLRGSGVEPVLLDVCDRGSLEEAARFVGQYTARPGDPSKEVCLVNNAGISLTGPLELLPLEDLRRQLEVNLVGSLSATQAFLPLMRRSGGRVVFIGSMFGRLPVPFVGPYCASKFALEGLSGSLRLELKPWGIPVSVVEPGVVNTPIWDKYDDFTDRLLSQLPEAGRRLYERRLSAARSFALESGKAGIPPGRVGKTVVRCLTSSRPRTHYPVGLEARLSAAGSRLLPPWLLDRLTLARIRMPR